MQCTSNLDKSNISYHILTLMSSMHALGYMLYCFQSAIVTFVSGYVDIISKDNHWLTIGFDQISVVVYCLKYTYRISVVGMCWGNIIEPCCYCIENATDKIRGLFSSYYISLE
jgi:hypothetical protein